MAKKVRMTPGRKGEGDREKAKMIADLTGEETTTGRRARKKRPTRKLNCNIDTEVYEAFQDKVEEEGSNMTFQIQKFMLAYLAERGIEIDMSS